MRPTLDSHAGKIAEDDYNGGGSCKRPAGTSVAIEDMDWSSMTESYYCFTRDFDANIEISTICDDGGDNNNSDDNSLAVILGVVAAVVVVVGIVVFAIAKRRKSAKPPAAAATPAHEPTAPIKALEMMAEETADFAPEAASLPPGHVSGAEAAMMAEGEPPPQPGSWFSGAAPEPEPEFEPEPEC